MPNLYVTLCTKIDGLNIVKVKFTIGEDEYCINCNYSEFGESFYGKVLSEKDNLEFVQFLQKGFEEEEFPE